MKISVIIPLFNKEHHIQRAIQSVLSQTHQDFELIIVDDGSTDDSFKAATSILDPRIRIVCQENQGVSAARNRGVSEAQSDWVAFLDADDEWLPDFLEKIIQLRSSFPDEHLFCTSYYFQDPNGEKKLPKTTPMFENNRAYLIDDYLSVLRIGLPFNSSSFSVTRKAYQESGGFTEGIAYQEDVDFWIRLSLYHKIVYLNSPLAIYHQDSENRACEKYDPIIGESYVIKSLIQMKRKDQIPNRLKKSANEYVAKYQIPLAKYHLLQKESKRAREVLQSCLGTRRYLPSWVFTYLCTYIPSSLLLSGNTIKNKLMGIKS